MFHWVLVWILVYVIVIFIKQMEVNQYKDKVQQEALSVIESDKHHRAKIYMATGTGKSRVPILYIKKYDLSDICLLVPTLELKKIDWPNEFKKWDAEKYLTRTTISTIRSCHKIKGKTFRLLIVDEAHNLTPNFFEFLANNTVGAVILLTATEPKKGEKARLIDSLRIESKYVVTLPQARKMGLVAPYDISVIFVPLDDKDKIIQIGKKDAPTFVTEKERYDFLCKQYELSLSGMGAPRKVAISQRMHFIYDLPSKAKVVKFLSEHYFPKEDKTLVFVGNSKIADYVCDFRYHSNMSAIEKKKNLEMFEKGEIKRLSAIKSLNEGKNISFIDNGLIGQVKSQEKDFIQQLGRIIRLRDGHRGKMVIVVAKDTQDEIWVKDALSGFMSDEVRYYHSLESFLLAHGNK